MRRPPLPVLLGLAAVAIAVASLVTFAIPRSKSSAENELQGDVDCDALVDSVDALHILRSIAELPQTADCLDAANVDCDDDRDAVDALRILRYIVQLANPVVSGCAPIGGPLAGTPTPTPAATPTPGPSPTGTVTPTPTATSVPTVTPTPYVFACPSPAPPSDATPRPDITGMNYSLVHVLPDSTWGDMLDFTLIPGANREAVVVRQNGEIWRISLDGDFGPTLFGDLDAIVKSGGEEGLLSLAFSPDFQSDGRVYVYYTRGAPGPSVLSRFQATNSCIDTSSETVIIEIPQLHSNHNGGRIVFGADGYLYLSLGDGGSAGDPQGNGQNKDSLLGKVLRLHVTGEATYAAPSDNPFVGTAGRDEIFAYGFRNPWRMSMDRQTGDIWLGDVGQDKWEEVDQVTLGGNYGWRCKEGFAVFEADGCPSDSAFTPPRAAYGHNGGNQAITGGYVYRGADMPELEGWYVYADAYSGRIWAVNTVDSSPPVQLLQTSDFIYSFAELADGELLILTPSGIYRLAHA